MIRNDIEIPRVSSRMVARIVHIQNRGKHNVRRSTVLPRKIPFWASAKTISIKDIYGNYEEDDDVNTENGEEADVPKYSILGQLNELDMGKLKTEYSKHEAEMYKQLSNRLARATEFSLGCSKIVPVSLQRAPRPPLLHSKHIDPSSRNKKPFVRVSETKGSNLQMVKEDSASTLQELDEFIELKLDDPESIDEEIIEDGLSADYRQFTDEFVNKRYIKFDRVTL